MSPAFPNADKPTSWVLRYRQQTAYWLISLTILGYPLTSILVSLMGLESRQATMPFRILVLVLSATVFLTVLIRPFLKQINLTLLFFCSLYLCRLCYDWLIATNPFAYTALEFYLAAAYIPSICVWFAVDGNFDDKKLAKLLLVFGGLFLLGYNACTRLGLITSFDSGGGDERAALTALNPISLGHAAASIFICAFYLISPKSKLHWNLILLVLVGCSIPVILQAASRGPMVSLLITIVWFASSKLSRAIYILPFLFVIPFLIPNDDYAIQRVTESLDGKDNLDSSALERLDLQKTAINDFLNNPWLGKYFLSPLSDNLGEYPHNLLIETAMALGLAGLFPLFFLLIKAILAILKSLHMTHPLVSMFFMYSLLAAQFSGTLWGNDKLILTLGLILVFNKLKRT